MALLTPDSKLESIWSLYPARRGLLMPYRTWLGPGFLLLAIIMASASIGCFRRRMWGWWLAIGIFLANGLSDAVQIVLGHFLEGGIGVIVTGAIPFLSVATSGARDVFLGSEAANFRAVRNGSSDRDRRSAVD